MSRWWLVQALAVNQLFDEAEKCLAPWSKEAPGHLMPMASVFLLHALRGNTAQALETISEEWIGPAWQEKDYAREHTEEAVRKLKELGVTMAVIHFYKGFGLEAEKEHMDDARRLADLCRKHGIRVGVYVGSTIAYETFLHEKPEAKEWFVERHLGRPVVYGDLRDLAKYGVLALPDQESMSGAQAAAVREYVQRGGGLILAEEALCEL